MKHTAFNQFRQRIWIFCGSFALAALGVAISHDEAYGDSSGQFPDPIVRTIEGWTVKIDPDVLSEGHREEGEQCLKALANHLQRIEYIVSPKSLQQMQTMAIWMHWEHELNNCQYHPGRGWLLAKGYDPRLVKHVHVPRARTLLDRKQWAKHPYLVLHEFAHAYHDQKLSFDHQPIIDAFDRMKQSGSYEKVLAHTGKTTRHYALSNHKEYFAESTEAFFGVNDFFPFVRAELKHHDPSMYELMETIWGKIP